MTNPVVLFGTQSNGETLPVQVDATGRLVAEGLQGQPGEKGDQGDQGEPGPPGPPGDFELPPNPEQGQVLGWDNGALAWFTIPGLDPGYRVTITEQVYPNDGQTGFRNGLQQLETPEEGWDAAARALPNWMLSPNTSNHMGVSTGTNQTRLDVYFDIHDALGQILEVKFYACFTKQSNKDTVLNFTKKAQILGENVTTINAQGTSKYDGRGTEFSQVTSQLTAQFLLNRENYEGLGVKFTYTNDTAISGPKFIVCSGWQLVDPGRVALENQAALAQEIKRLAADRSFGSGEKSF